MRVCIFVLYVKVLFVARELIKRQCVGIFFFLAGDHALNEEERFRMMNKLLQEIRLAS